MTELLTAAQMRAIEQAAIESGEVTGLELMERAGAGVVEAIFEEWPELAKTSHRAVVLCGPGNNGGDGFVVARLLKEAGFNVFVFLVGDWKELPEDAKANYLAWRGMNQPVFGYFSTDKEGSSEMFRKTMDAEESENTLLVIDALFGIGINRYPKEILDYYEEHSYVCKDVEIYDNIYHVSIDIPTGISVETGKSLAAIEDQSDNTIRVDLTVTFHAKKPCHFKPDRWNSCGKVVVKDIGLSKWSKISPLEA